MRRFPYDTSIFVYALDRERPYKLAWWHYVEPRTGAFDGIDDLERVDPADKQEVAALIG